MAKARKTGLGRGLGALMGEANIESASPVANTEQGLQEEAAAAPARTEDMAEETPPDRSDITAGADYIKDEQAAEEAEQAQVTEREARPQVATPVKPGMDIAGENVHIHGIVNREAGVEGEVSLASIVPNPDQPRTNFKKEDLDELANSIEKEGLLQPILVREVGETYQIIAGERRWQACKQLGLKTVPVRIIDANDDKAVELALVENIQRSDLNPIEEAYGYKRLMERRGMTQSDVAQAVSKGRSTIANALRLLDLPEDAQQLLYEEKITAGHARAILSIPTREGRQKLTDKLKEGQLSVREAESLARLFSGTAKGEQGARAKATVPAYFKSVAKSVKERLNTNVRIRNVGGKNKLEIEFADEDDLKRMLSKLLDG